MRKKTWDRTARENAKRAMVIEGSTVYADSSRSVAWHFGSPAEARAFYRRRLDRQLKVHAGRRKRGGGAFCSKCNGPHVHKHGRP